MMVEWIGERAMNEPRKLTVLSFHTLAPEDFPITAQLLDLETNKVVWHVIIPAPRALRIPSKDEINKGRPVYARITWPGGMVTEMRPDDNV